MPQCDQLLNPRLRVSARTGVARRIALAHNQLRALVADPANQYVGAGAQAEGSTVRLEDLHTSEQVCTLLDVDPQSV